MGKLPAGWLSSDGAAAHIGAASLPTLYELVNDGTIPAYRVGRPQVGSRSHGGRGQLA